MKSETDQEIAEIVAEITEQCGDDPAAIEEIAEYFNFHAALERAVARYPGLNLRERTDPCIVRCCRWPTAIDRCTVRYYLGAESRPAPGSSYSMHEHWGDVVRELRLMGFPDDPRCVDCERVWSSTHCGCRGGSCSPRPVGAMS
jgi:hypothetical protein